MYAAASKKVDAMAEPKAIKKQELIEVIRSIPLLSSQKENIVLAVRKAQEPFSLPHVSFLFTLLDLFSGLQNPSDQKTHKQWKIAIKFYKKYALDTALPLPQMDLPELSKVVEDIFECQLSQNFSENVRKIKRSK